MNNNLETNKRNDANMYDVSTYTDKELYNILDLDSPSDRELEAKIIFLIKKYKNIQNASGDQLADFFENIYKRFFESDEDEMSENGDEEDEIEEGFENITDETNNQEMENARQTQTQPTNAVMNVKQIDKAKADNIGYTKSLEYANDKLNPLLQQTVKRIISIDSQYRDDKTTLSTEFTFNLSDPLKDVVSLKLYSVQIPYTWYTINNNFGSNFFVLKGNVDGIDNGNHDYQIDISAGNYSPQELTDTINESMINIRNVYTDVSFGNTNISYNRFNSLISMNVDIYKQYNETSYYLQFPTWSSPELEAENRRDTIPSFLGLNNDNYKMFQIESAKTLPLTVGDPNEDLRFTISNTNNYFTIYKYIGDNYNEENIGMNVDLSWNIVLSNLRVGGSYTRGQISEQLDLELKRSPYILSSESGIFRELVTYDVRYTYFTLKIKPNRVTTNNISNSKLQIKFPSEELTDTVINYIWTGNNSCFRFASQLNEINNIVSEYSPLESSTIQYTIQSDPYIYLYCNKPGYDVSTNAYKIQVPNTTTFPYRLNSYIDVINSGFINVDNSSNFTTDNTFVEIDTETTFQAQFDLTKTITTENFQLDLTGSFLNTVCKFATSYDLSDNGGVYTSDPFPFTDTYEIPSTGKLAIFKARQAGKNVSGELLFEVEHPLNTSGANRTPYLTGTERTLETVINQKFSQFQDSDNVNVLFGTNVRFTINPNSTVTAVLTVSVNKQLTEADFTVQFLEDTNYNITTNDFTLDLSGGIGNIANQYITYNNDTNEHFLDATQISSGLGVLFNTFKLSGETTYDSETNSLGVTSTAYIPPNSSENYSIDSDYIAFISYKNLAIPPYYGISVQYGSSDPYGYLIPSPTVRSYNDLPTLVLAINNQFKLFTDLSGSNLTITSTTIQYEYNCTLNIQVSQRYNQDTWYKNLNISRGMIDVGYRLQDNETEPELSYISTNASQSIALGVKGSSPISAITFNCTAQNNRFELIPYDEGVISNTNINKLSFTLPLTNADGSNILYTRSTLLEQMNNTFIGTIAEGSNISIITDEDGKEYTKIRITINKEYTSKDYRIVFYDPYSFVRCFSGVNSVRNVTWDTTLGWILGFRESTIYYLSDYTISRSASILADTGISTNLFNYFLITLDDYNQNHLNDGLVTITTKETEIPLPSYANRTNYICDPITKELTYNTTLRKDYSKLTQNQIYSLTQIANSKNIANQTSGGEVSAKNYGSGPFAKDVFGIIPMKLSGLKNGDSFVEYGGTLQNQERIYFGPVNIQRMTVKLLGDRGNVVDLNGANWSFSLICEHLYRPQINGKQ